MAGIINYSKIHAVKIYIFECLCFTINTQLSLAARKIQVKAVFPGVNWWCT